VTTEAYVRTLQALDFTSAEQWQAALHSSGVERQRILTHCRTTIQNYDIIELTAQIVEQVRLFDGRCIGCGLQRDARLSRPYADAGPTARTIRGLIFSGGVVLPVVRDVFLVVADRAQVAPCNAGNRYASTGRCLVRRGRGAERISTTSMYRQHFEWENHGPVDRP
jgi:hypothetical protein